MPTWCWNIWIKSKSGYIFRKPIICILFTLFFHFFANVEHSQMLPQSVKEGQSFIMQIMYFYCLIGTINFLCLGMCSVREWEAYFLAITLPQVLKNLSRSKNLLKVDYYITIKLKYYYTHKVPNIIQGHVFLYIVTSYIYSPMDKSFILVFEKIHNVVPSLLLFILPF